MMCPRAREGARDVIRGQGVGGGNTRSSFESLGGDRSHEWKETTQEKGSRPGVYGLVPREGICMALSWVYQGGRKRLGGGCGEMEEVFRHHPHEKQSLRRDGSRWGPLQQVCKEWVAQREGREQPAIPTWSHGRWKPCWFPPLGLPRP